MTNKPKAIGTFAETAVKNVLLPFFPDADRGAQTGNQDQGDIRHCGQFVFEVKGGKAAAFRLMNAMQLVKVSNNLGDSKSLATHPATTTHMRIGEAERARLGITDGVIRLSVGLEDVRDITDDLARGLAAI